MVHSKDTQLLETSFVLSFDESWFNLLTGQSPTCCQAQASYTITFMTKEDSTGQNKVFDWASWVFSEPIEEQGK